MKHGVPQGSVLGPLLFLIYINDMPNCSDEFKYTLFADDTCLFMKHKNYKTLEQNINHELQKINEWLVNNRLSLNVTKSCFLLFSNKRNTQDFNISISGAEVENVKTTKYLGVLFDENLDWKPQIEQVLIKVKQGTGILKKVSYLLPPQCLKSIYYSFIQSHLQYCITAWGSPKTPSSSLNSIVKRNSHKINKRANGLPQFNFTPLNFNDIYRLECCKLAYNFVNNTIPTPLNNLFQLAATHGRITRHSQQNSLKVIHLHNSGTPASFHVPIFWNQLCLSIASSSPSSFVSSLKKKLN